MSPLNRKLSVLLIGYMLLACGDDQTSEEHLNNAKAFQKQSNSASAIIELKNALSKDVNNSRARALMGKIYFETGEYESADKELSRALSSGVDSTVVVPILAQVLLSLGEYERLESLSLDGLDPENRSIVQAARSLSLLYRGNQKVATEIMDAALQNEPNSSYAQVAAARLAMGTDDFVEARSRLQEVFTKNPEYAPAWNLLGDIESAERRPEKAEEAYTKAINLSEYSFEAQLNRAMMRIYLGNIDGAANDLGQLKQRYSWVMSHPGVDFAWGLVYLQRKKLLEAEKAFERASEFSNAYPLTLYYLAAIKLEGGFVQQALSDIYRFLSIVPFSVVGAKLAAKLELGQEGYGKAEALLLPIVAERPDDVEALNLLASALLAQGKSGEGVERLARIVELQPDSEQAKVRLGAGFLAMGSEELGVETLREILKNDPGYEQADILIVLNYLRRDKFPEALKAAKEYRDRNPASATSYNLLGRAYRASEDKERAKVAFSKALDLRPGDPGAGNSLADFALQERNYKLARTYYTEVLKHHPEHMQTLMNVAASNAVEGNEQELMNSLNTTLEIYPRAMEPRLLKARYYLAKSQLDKAASVLAELTDEQQEHPDALVTIAGYELGAGRYNQSLATLGKLIGARPDVSQYHYMKARAYAGLGNMEYFSAELDRALELDPSHFYARIAQARLALLMNRNEEFQQKFSELKGEAPDNPDVMKLEIAAAQKKGDSKTALRLLETVFQQVPTINNVIALAAQRQSEGDIDGAIVQLQHWLEKHSDDLKARETLAELYSSSNRIGGAVYQYQEILKLKPDHPIVLNNLAWYLLDDDPKQALAYAEKAIILSPDSGSILDTLAMAQMKNESMIEARRSIDRALALAPDSPELHFHEAQISVAEGDTVRAIDTLTMLLGKPAKFSERAEAEAFLKQLK